MPNPKSPLHQTNRAWHPFQIFRLQKGLGLGRFAYLPHHGANLRAASLTCCGCTQRQVKMAWQFSVLHNAIYCTTPLQSSDHRSHSSSQTPSMPSSAGIFCLLKQPMPFRNLLQPRSNLHKIFYRRPSQLWYWIRTLHFNPDLALREKSHPNDHIL